MQIEIGVSLPTFVSRSDTIPHIPTLATHVEQVGLDAVWAGDHLCTGAPFMDSTIALTAAAAVTSRVRLGFGVMLIALRQQAWAAKQVSSLQHLSGNRVLLGVGAGGEKPDEWRIGGVPFSGRGRRTDTMLRALPDLLGGRQTPLLTEPGEPTATLEPPAAMPPVWVGGVSDRALRRATDYGDGWLSSLLGPADFARGTAKLAAMAHARGVPSPAAATTVFAALTNTDTHVEHARVVNFLRHLTGLPEQRVGPLVVSGPPRRLAERLDDYVQAGASTFVVNLSGTRLRQQYDLLAETRELLLSAGG